VSIFFSLYVHGYLGVSMLFYLLSLPAQVFRAQAATVGATRAEDAAVAVTNGPPSVNPGLHLDVALNLVVLQFFNAQGDVTQSIPSQKQLEAYAQDGSDPSQTVSKLL
jgi:hypothetical protein